MRAILVTGGAGFLGSNLVRALNAEGRDDVIILDNLQKEGKWKNLLGLRFQDFVDYRDGLSRTEETLASLELDAILHVGANTDVLVHDASVMAHQNFAYSKLYLEAALAKGIPFIYGSSSAIYGNTKRFTVEESSEHPHNPYGLSKLMFDSHVRSLFRREAPPTQVIGYRFFNIYGLHEFHKRHNASLQFRFYEFMRDKGFIDLFEGAEGIARDYIRAQDVAKVILESLKRPLPSGIFNLGTGMPLSHRRLAEIVVDVFLEKGRIAGAREEFIRQIPFPKELEGVFQFLTRAENTPPWYGEMGLAPPEAGTREYITQLVEMGA
jgi:ADP-L-glycero-D-manno-heptose 6-epimerase